MFTRIMIDDCDDIIIDHIGMLKRNIAISIPLTGNFIDWKKIFLGMLFRESYFLRHTKRII